MQHFWEKLVVLHVLMFEHTRLEFVKGGCFVCSGIRHHLPRFIFCEMLNNLRRNSTIILYEDLTKFRLKFQSLDVFAANQSLSQSFRNICESIIADVDLRCKRRED